MNVQAIFAAITKEEKKVTNFSVVLDDERNAKLLVKYINKYKLSSEDNWVFLEEGRTSLAFFYSDKFDVEAIETPIENVLRGLTPRYYVSRDLWDIVNLIQEGAEKKAALRKELRVKGKSLKALIDLKKAVAAERRAVANLLHSNLLGMAAASPCGQCPLRNICGQRQQPKREVRRSEEIYVSDHLIQIGSKIIDKNPNDIVRIRYA